MIDTLEMLVRKHGLLLWSVVFWIWTAIAAGSLWTAWNRRIAQRRFWLVVGLIFVCLATDFRLNLRYELTEVFRSLVKSFGGYEAYQGRRPFQAVLLIGLGLAVILGAWRLRAEVRQSSWPHRLAASGAVAGLLSYLLELVSLHQVDRYRLIYWTPRFIACALAVPGLILEWLPISRAPGGTARPTRFGDLDDTPARRFVRLVIALMLLALPEIVNLVLGAPRAD